MTTTVRRWRRYGKDRLYVSDADGTYLGWHDLVTGQTHYTVISARDKIDLTIDTWCDQCAEEVPSPRSSVETGSSLSTLPAPHRTRDDQVIPGRGRGVDSANDTNNLNAHGVDTMLDEIDLAKNQPGARLRLRAAGARREAPIRAFVARLFGIHTQERAWRLGADGEVLVGDRLARLHHHDPRWRVLHSIPIGHDLDLDHLVVGPAGVFSINTKHHPGARVWVGQDRFLVNGHSVGYVHASLDEAERATRVLSHAVGEPIAVTAMIVLVNADSLKIASAPDDVVILTRCALDKWLAHQPIQLDDARINRVFSYARRADVWRMG